jgi:hypothetical protein
VPARHIGALSIPLEFHAHSFDLGNLSRRRTLTDTNVNRDLDYSRDSAHLWKGAPSENQVSLASFLDAMND